METERLTLKEIIIQKIRQQGPVSFRDFMEMALYYPGLGYYTSGDEKIGNHGDYYTSPWLTSIFGEMIAKQLEEMWKILGRKNFTVVEYGGGNGKLCHDIIQQLHKNRELYDQLHYCIIEKKGRLNDDEKLTEHGKLSRHESLDDIPVVNGVVISNELVDNFSTNQVVMLDGLMEVFVDYKSNEFVELLQPASAILKDYLAQLQIMLPKGFRTEINLQAIDWIKNVARRLNKGFVVTIDYGYSSSDLYTTNRSKGTLVCYHQHAINYCPYINIGKQDITTHVNFSALNHWGSKNGLQYNGFTNQAGFLLGLGLSEHIHQKERENKSEVQNNKSKAMLLHTFLADMGRKFKVLIQNKGMPKSILSGLQFSQPYI
jgi:SAM-dependent MidA family methyltransferase